MTGSSQSLHEREEKLSARTINQHRAIVSLMEELEAVDWYAQRVDATDDEELKRILAHNRDEEMEHAVMTIEWLRRNNDTFAAMLKKFLYREGPIVAEDHESMAGHQPQTRPADGSLGLGNLREEEEVSL